VITDQTAPDGGRDIRRRSSHRSQDRDRAHPIEGEHVKALKAAVLGDSDELEVGDQVIAIASRSAWKRR